MRRGASRWLAIAPVAAALALAGHGWTSGARAASADGLTLTLTAPATIDGIRAFDLTLTVSNHGPTACEVSAATTATVILGVTRDGQPVRPSLLGPGTFPGGLAAPAATRVPLPPGATVTIVVPHATSAVQTVSGLPEDDTTGLTQEWSLAERGTYALRVALSPQAVAGCPPPAPATATIAATGPESTPSLPMIGVAAGIVLVLGVLVALVVRRRRGARAIVAVVVIVAGSLTMARPASAQIFEHVVTSDVAPIVDGCLRLFASPGGDPAGVFFAASRTAKTITIGDIGGTGVSPTSSKGATTPGVGSDARIEWYPYSSIGQTQDGTSDECADLYLLLALAVQMTDGTYTVSQWCGDMPLAGARAAIASNAYRSENHLSPLISIHGHLVPTSLDGCPKPAKPRAKTKLRLTCGDRPCGSLGGDPHLRTYDGLRYDVQAVGEFELTRSDDGTFEIQARQQAVTAWSAASVATAVAARIGESRAMISLATDAGIAGMRLVVAIDGAPDTAVGPLSLGSAGSVERTEDGGQVALRWADGSIALAGIIPGEGIDVEILPAASLRGHLEGLLGNDDGSSAGDLRFPDGSTLPTAASALDLDGRFADAWRLTDATSLFSYAPGTDTATFTDRAFPPAAAATPSDGQVESAREVCLALGIDPARQDDLSNCAFDLAATGQASFASSGISRSQEPADDAVELGGSSRSPEPTPPTSGGTVDRGSIAPGDVVSGRFGSPDERELYRFHADAGSVGFFTAAGDCSSLSGTATPTWYLARAASPDRPITAALPFCVDLGRFAFQQSDDYAVVVVAGGFTLPYGFTWASVATSSPQPVSLGQLVNGSLDTAGERDVYVLTTTGAGLDVTISSPMACVAGLVWKVSQGDSSPGLGTLCGTSSPIHLGGAGEWQVTISAPDGIPGQYSFRIDAQP